MLAGVALEIYRVLTIWVASFKNESNLAVSVEEEGIGFDECACTSSVEIVGVRSMAQLDKVGMSLDSFSALLAEPISRSP